MVWLCSDWFCYCGSFVLVCAFAALTGALSVFLLFRSVFLLLADALSVVLLFRSGVVLNLCFC